MVFELTMSVMGRQPIDRYRRGSIPDTDRSGEGTVTESDRSGPTSGLLVRRMGPLSDTERTAGDELRREGLPGRDEWIDRRCH